MFTPLPSRPCLEPRLEPSSILTYFTASHFCQVIFDSILTFTFTMALNPLAPAFIPLSSGRPLLPPKVSHPLPIERNSTFLDYSKRFIFIEGTDDINVARLCFDWWDLPYIDSIESLEVNTCRATFATIGATVNAWRNANRCVAIASWMTDQPLRASLCPPGPLLAPASQPRPSISLDGAPKDQCRNDDNGKQEFEDWYHVPKWEEGSALWSLVSESRSGTIEKIETNDEHEGVSVEERPTISQANHADLFFSVPYIVVLFHI